MPVRLRPLLGLAALIALSLALSPYEGYYTRGSFSGAMIALVFSVAACLTRDRWLRISQGPARLLIITVLLSLSVQCFSRFVFQNEGDIALVGVFAQVLAILIYTMPIRINLFSAIFFAGALLLAGNAIIWTPLLYTEVPLGARAIRFVASMGLTFIALTFFDLKSSSVGYRTIGLRIVLVFVAGGLLRAGAIWASPEPVIDVFGWLREAPGYVLHGQNPYAADYQSPYGTPRAFQYQVYMTPEARPASYPPLPILLALPFRIARIDVRMANVLCDLVAALVLVAAATSRGQATTGLLTAGVYLNLPRVPFVIEQGWYEPMLAAMLGAGLWFCERKRWLGYLLLGLGLTGKQFGLILLFPLLRAMRRQWRKLAAGIALALAIVVVPFVAWGPADFFASVIWKHFQRPSGYHSISFLSAAHDWFGIAIPRMLLWGLGGWLIAWITCKTPENGIGTGLWLGTALLVFSLFHTQGHFNYFYLCQYLWLLGIVGLTAGVEEPVLESI